MHRIEVPAANAVRPLCAGLLILALAAAPAAQAAPAAAPAAASPAPAAPAKAAADDNLIMPYLDDGTFLVIRVDIDRIDGDALAKWMGEVTESQIKMMNLPAPQQEGMRQNVVREAEGAKGWLAAMSEAGGRHLYVLLDLNDLQTGEDDPVIVVPLVEGADADRIAGQFPQGRQARAEVVGKGVVVTEPGQMERVKRRFEPGAAPVERPDLAAAFAAAGADAPARLALVPGESARKFIEERVPTLPKPLGGGESGVLARGLRWASVGVRQKPQTTATVTFQATDAAQAKALQELINKATGFAEETAAANPRGFSAVGKQLAEIEPALKGDRVTVSDIDPMMLMNGLRFAVMQARPAQLVAPPPAAAGPAQPAKPDDGGL